MSAIDVIIVIPLVWFLYKGFSNGLIIELTKLSALILGIFGAINFSDYTADVLMSRFEFNPQYIGVVSFAITFIGIIILVHFAGKALDKMIDAVALGTLNRLLGMMFGLLKAVLIVSMIVYFFDSINTKFDMVSVDSIQGSRLFKPMLEAANRIFEFFNSENLSSNIMNLSS
ncbi:MAG: CvpA family protein [Marinifilaceae bacterium]|jgi:membrane protein required for colicin V production|nr:CvpA family protein [Marinifilaceae bacterium]